VYRVDGWVVKKKPPLSLCVCVCVCVSAPERLRPQPIRKGRPFFFYIETLFYSLYTYISLTLFPLPRLPMFLFFILEIIFMPSHDAQPVAPSVTILLSSRWLPFFFFLSNPFDSITSFRFAHTNPASSHFFFFPLGVVPLPHLPQCLNQMKTSDSTLINTISDTTKKYKTFDESADRVRPANTKKDTLFILYCFLFPFLACTRSRNESMNIEKNLSFFSSPSTCSRHSCCRFPLRIVRSVFRCRTRVETQKNRSVFHFIFVLALPVKKRSREFTNSKFGN